jgi:hypothetical protein
MQINFYATHYFSSQTWADNYEKSRDRENLKKYQGTIKESYNATNGDLIHFVEYEKGTILVQDIDKLD